MTNFAKLTVEDFLAAIGADTPTPGGGTAAAMAGAMGASLAEMVGRLTVSKEKYAASHDAVRPILEAGSLAREEFVTLSREDSEAYDAVVAARRLPKDTDEQKAARAHALALANRRATEVPMRTARAAARLLAALPELAEKGNPNAASDVGAAALLLDACCEGALLNVGINLSGIEDAALVAEMQRETAVLQEASQRFRSHVVASVRKRF
ncbi:MAG TPA: cyclodeaminase/cyclohydrolase family protein [Thermoanaerobaculia bacterium]|jgi:glutamate formiminotransferase/formiminotetrahydrofolate cyclodeaminase|nr:cyclodeaminase/cyclohydrolase family protein [Thermoanaerobaculia bacterium]